MYTLIETAKLNDVDRMGYLIEAVLASRRGEILLPWEMARGARRARPAHITLTC